MNSGDEEALLIIATNLKRKPIKNYTRDVHILSFAFLLIFLAYGAAQNLETTINKELGTISLGILYSSFTIFSTVASLIVRVIGSKNALVLGTTGYWLFVAANLKPSWSTMIPASLYLGFASAITWVGQGTYLTSIARSHAKDHNLHEASVIGVFNGEFWAVYAFHQVVGNLVSLAVLRDGKGRVNLYMTSTGIPNTEGSTNGTTLLFTMFLCSMTLGTVLMCFLRKVDSEKNKGAISSSVTFYTSFNSVMKSIVNPLLDTRMLLIVPLIAYSGLQAAFVWAEFTKDIVKPAIGVSGVTGSMVVYGLFDAICSISAGRLTSGLPSITFIVSGGASAHAIVFIWLLLRQRITTGVLGIIYPLVMAALLGIGNGVLNTQLSALLGLLFKQDTEGAFAQLKVWHSACVAAVFFLSPYISLQAMLLLLLSGLFFSVLPFYFLVFRVEKVFSTR